MTGFTKRRAVRGQGLAEYALLISLVVLVAAVLLTLIGLAASRGLGMMAAVIGTQHDESSVIQLESAHCYVSSPFEDTHFGKTTLEITGHLTGNLTRSDLSISSDQGFIYDIGQYGDDATGFKASVNLPSAAVNAVDASLCPRGVVVQSISKKLTAFRPVKVVIP